MITFDDLDIIRKPKLRIITRRQMRQKLNLERRLRKKDKLIKLNIFKNLYFKSIVNSTITLDKIYNIHIKNFVYYLLDKLYFKNKYLYFIYFYYRYKLINNINNSMLYLEFLSQDFLLYNLLWSNIKIEYFFYKNEKIQSIFLNKKKIVNLKENNNKLLYLKNYFYKFYNKICNTYNFTNSILILFFEYLTEIKIENIKEVNNLKFEAFKEIKKVNLKENFNLTFNLVYEEINFYNFEVDYTAYKKYVDVLDKNPIILLTNRNKILNEIFIEELLYNWTNINKYPLLYINIIEYKKQLLILSLKPFEINFHLKLANIHNINLKHLSVPLKYNEFYLEKKKKKKDNLDSIYNNIYYIKILEESKIYSDTIFILEFLEKTCLQLIEISLYKLKYYFNNSYEELINNLYLSIDSQLNFIKFYNYIVKNIKNQINNLNLEYIIFISEFLEFLYLICKNFNLYNQNIFNFNLYKLQSILGDIRFLEIKLFKKIFYLNNEKNLNYENFLFNIYSFFNVYKNIIYYSNIYSFIISTKLNILNDEDFKIFNNIKKANISKLIFSYELNLKNTFKELYTKRIYWRLVYFYYNHFDLRCQLDYKKKIYSIKIFELHEKFFNELDIIFFNFYYIAFFLLQTYMIQMIYKYKYNIVFNSLYFSFLSMLNIDLLFYNINQFKSFITKLEIDSYNLYKKIFFKFLTLNLNIFYIYAFNIWRIFNIKDIYIKLKKNKNFINFNELFIKYLFSSLTVHYNHNLNIHDIVDKYKELINLYNDKKHKIVNDRNIDNKNFKLYLIKKNKV